MACVTPRDRISPEKHRTSADDVLLSGADKDLQEDFSAKLNFSTSEPSQPPGHTAAKDGASQATGDAAQTPGGHRPPSLQHGAGLPRHKRSVPKFLNELSVRSRSLKAPAEAGPKLVHAASEGCLVVHLRRHLPSSRST